MLESGSLGPSASKGGRTADFDGVPVSAATRVNRRGCQSPFEAPNGISTPWLSVDRYSIC